jgi:hypothetical protein
MRIRILIHNTARKYVDKGSVVDRHRFDAVRDPDPTFQFDADLDPDPTLSFTLVGKSELSSRLLWTAVWYTVYIFLVRIKGIIIFDVVDSTVLYTVLQLYGKSLVWIYIWLK